MNKAPQAIEIEKFRGTLLRWFKKNKRDYPWRNTINPFRVLIAEMMLQRTKADQVVTVYKKFFMEFKKPSDVTHVTMRKLNRLLYPLGLKWRIKRFKEVSQELINNFNGKVPQKRDEILTLPGVGEYVAGIVLSIAFNKKEWIVDSNVVRVVKRYFGISTSKEGRRDKHVIELAKKYVNSANPKNANLALLDFAALICTPRSPKHNECPLSKNCRFLIQYSNNRKKLKI